MGAMKSKPKSDEFTAFQSALRQVLQVPKSELDRRIREEKELNSGRPKRGRKPKTSLGHVCDDKG